MRNDDAPIAASPKPLRWEDQAAFERAQGILAVKRIIDGKLLAAIRQLDVLKACNAELLHLCKEHGPAAKAVATFVEVCPVHAM